MEHKQITKDVPEIVRRNVKEVIDILIEKGYQYQQMLINQYLKGQKSQYEFLLPKSRHYRYFTQQLNNHIHLQRERKLPNLQLNQQKSQKSIYSKEAQKQSRMMTIVGTVQQVSVGAMCQLIKQLRQNKQPYEPFDNQVYEQQIAVTVQDEHLNKKVGIILDMIQAIKTPQNLQQQNSSPQRLLSNKMDMLRSQLGTQKDGSLGAWGGKKYEGLGMRDQFTNYRKQTSKNFYQGFPR